jgi:thioredoxin-like negative regulator of GroEL
VERYQGKPFALVGVNCDNNAEIVQHLQSIGKVTWPSFCQGADKIGAAYGVRGLPTVVVIDHKGIVRSVYVGPPEEPELDRQLSDLIAEAETPD